MAFEKSRNLHFPLLSDFQPRGAVSKAYRVFREQDGMSERALFVIDGEGVVRKVFPRVKVDGHAERVLEAVRAL